MGSEGLAAPTCSVCRTPISSDTGRTWVIRLTSERLLETKADVERPVGEDGVFCSKTCLMQWAHNDFKRPSYLL